LFLQENYQYLVKLLSASGFEHKSKKYEEYFFEVIAIELLARLQLGKFDDESEKLLRKYEQNLKPTMGGASTFHGALRKIISGFNKSGNSDVRKKVTKEHLQPLRTAMNAANHYHKVIVQWLEKNYDH
jgi:hypothetical protein